MTEIVYERKFPNTLKNMGFEINFYAPNIIYNLKKSKSKSKSKKIKSNQIFINIWGCLECHFSIVNGWWLL